MYNLYDKMDIRGHVQISKLFPDGTEEIVHEDHNVIVSGMGVGLATMFALSGSTSIIDYQIDRFQLGVSGNATLEVSTTYELSGPLSSVAEYTGAAGASNLLVASADQLANRVILDNPPGPCALIPFHNVNRIDETTVRYTILVDQDSCNGIQRDSADASLNEIGLFMKNPLGLATDTPILVAYKNFSNIVKSNDFALIFRWNINF